MRGGGRFLISLNDQGLLQGLDIDHPPAQQKIAEILPESTGGRADHLALRKMIFPSRLAVVQRQHPGFAAEADNLEDFPQTEVFEVSDKAHENSAAWLIMPAQNDVTFRN